MNWTSCKPVPLLIAFCLLPALVLVAMFVALNHGYDCGRRYAL